MNTFVASDHHLFHARIMTFTKNDGSPLRSFSSVEEMNEHIIACHNSIVGKNDTVYFLGDVVMGNATKLQILERFNGVKVLVRGNHDQASTANYLLYFKEVIAYKRLQNRLLLSHMPVHPGSIPEGFINVHGHLHDSKLDDPRYFNVSMECINYTPLAIDKI